MRSVNFPQLQVHAMKDYQQPSTAVKAFPFHVQATPSRIVVLTSSAHMFQKKAIPWDDIDFSRRKYSPRVRHVDAGRLCFHCI